MASGYEDQTLADALGIGLMSEDLPAPSWNIKPTQDARIVLETLEPEPARRLVSARWSLVPPWSKTLRLPYATFNARAEDITTKRSFAGAVRKQRCVFPVQAFYEWSEDADGRRTPHAIAAQGPQPLLLAGLYSWWRDPAASEAGWLLTATVLTREASGPITRLHHRMPILLQPDSDNTVLSEWLNPGVPGDQALVDRVSDYSLRNAEHLTFTPVAPLRGDGPTLLDAAR